MRRREEEGVAEQLTPRTPDLEVRGPSHARRVISFRQGTLHHFVVSLHSDVEMGIGDILLVGGGEGNPGMD